MLTLHASISWFVTNDLYQRISILFLLACLFGYTTNITQAWDNTYAQLIGFYLTARLYMGTYLLIVAIVVPMIRGVMILHLASLSIGVALWVASIYVSWPNQLALIWIALFVDISGHMGIMLVRAVASLIGPNASAKADSVFEFYPALNIEHKVERTNAFVTLVFGYTVVAMLYQNQSKMGLNAFLGKAILGLVQAFCFNWLYFEIDSSNLYLHAIRRHKSSAMFWINAHLPFIMGFVLAGGALSKLVAASDCHDAHVDDLTEAYQSRSEPEVVMGIRWFYCGGLGVALACMGTWRGSDPLCSADIE